MSLQLGADADALKVLGGKWCRQRRDISAEETHCCEQQTVKTGHLIKIGKQRNVSLDCHQGNNRYRELERVAVAQGPSSPCLWLLPHPLMRLFGISLGPS